MTAGLISAVLGGLVLVALSTLVGACLALWRLAAHVAGED